MRFSEAYQRVMLGMKVPRMRPIFSTGLPHSPRVGRRVFPICLGLDHPKSHFVPCKLPPIGSRCDHHGFVNPHPNTPKKKKQNGLVG